MRAWLLVVLAACGDNALAVGVPLARAPNLTIVAHQDDDLLFMQPDLLEVAQRGEGMVNVYVTAGNGAHDDVEVPARRDEGLMQAYSAATGVRDWQCGTITVAGHLVDHCRLEDAAISLVFLGYPDGGKQGEQPESLLRLWTGQITHATTIAAHPTTYDQAGLIATLAEVIATTAPSTIRTLDLGSTHGRDHPDHEIAGALALLAAAQVASPAALFAYRGYNTDQEPANLNEPLFARSSEVFRHYDACASQCAPCGEACPTLSDAHTTWLHRRYAIARRPRAHGQLRSGTSCVAPTADGVLKLGDCASAPSWDLGADGLLRTDTRCVHALPTGELIATPTCATRDDTFFLLDDEGHLWSGITPPAVEVTPDAHLLCVSPAGGRARASVCGGNAAASWTFEPATAVTDRASLQLPATLALGDLDGDGHADLCGVAGDLRCASGDAAGGFTPATAITPLAIEPATVMLGDLDGDGLTDACGRGSAGITCTLRPADAALFTPALADASELAIADGGAICGVTAAGLVCAHAASSALELRSPTPRPGQPLWQGDLDGDQHTDWCTSSPAGIACGLAAERDLTNDAVPWAFARAGVVPPAPLDRTIAALGDIDGDGLADLCSVDADTISCMRSQRHGFGPAIVLARLPSAAPVTALWIGAGEVCVEQAGAIVCAR